MRDFFEARRASGASATIGLADGALRTRVVLGVRKADFYSEKTLDVVAADSISLPVHEPVV
jgi:hypothetical protein